MRVLYLTGNPTLGASVRTLPDWVEVGRPIGLEFAVVFRTPGLLQALLNRNGVPHCVNSMPWPDRWRPWRSVPQVVAAWHWARRLGCELIHCEHDVYPFAALLARLSGWPTVCQVHYSITREFAEWAFRLGRGPDALLWTTAQQADDCREAVDGVVPPARQDLLPLGVSLDRFGTRSDVRAAQRQAWGIRPDEVVLGAACAFRSRKRVEDFIALVAELAWEDDRVVGLLVGETVPGDESYRDQVLALLGQARLGRRLQYRGYLDDVEPFYHALDVFISTSEYETFGMSVCEAMACGKPVVGYCGGAVHEVVGDGGVIVPTGDKDELTAAVRDLVRRPDYRAELGQLGRRRVAARYNPTDSGQRLADLYCKVIAAKKGRA